MAHQLVACKPGLPLVEAKRKTDDAWRGTGNGENKEDVEMMLSAEASLEVKDERLARGSSSWVNDDLRKDDIDYCQKMCDKPFG